MSGFKLLNSFKNQLCLRRKWIAIDITSSVIVLRITSIFYYLLISN